MRPDSVAEKAEQVLWIERLQKYRGAEPQRHVLPLIHKAGDDDDGQFRLIEAHEVDQSPPALRSQPQIGYQEIRPVGAHVFERRIEGVMGDDPVTFALEHCGQRRHKSFIIVDDHDFAHGAGIISGMHCSYTLERLNGQPFA